MMMDTADMEHMEAPAYPGLFRIARSTRSVSGREMTKYKTDSKMPPPSCEKWVIQFFV